MQVVTLHDSSTATRLAKYAVYVQSLVVIGAFFYFPLICYYIYKKCKTTKQKAIAIGSIIFSIICPISSNYIYKHSSFIWNPINQYFRIKVITSITNYMNNIRNDNNNKQSIFAVFPHGIIPFSVGLTNFGNLNKFVFRNLHLVTATATKVFLYNYNLICLC